VSIPLGDHEPFHRWSGKPRAWGLAGAGWRVWFGGAVIDGLCEVLDEHLAAPRRTGKYGSIAMNVGRVGCAMSRVA